MAAYNLQGNAKRKALDVLLDELRIIFDKCVRDAVIMLGCFLSKGKVIYTQGEDIKVN